MSSPTEKADFVTTYLPVANTVACKYGGVEPLYILAIAAVQSDYGTLADNLASKNFFNLLAEVDDWAGSTYIDGDGFVLREYPAIDDSFNDFARFRYRSAQIRYDDLRALKLPYITNQTLIQDAIDYISPLIGSCGGGGGGTLNVNPVQEEPSGAVDGGNVDFVLSYKPVSEAGIIMALDDGTVYRAGVDFTWDGNVTVTFVSPPSGSSIWAYYLTPVSVACEFTMGAHDDVFDYDFDTDDEETFKYMVMTFIERKCTAMGGGGGTNFGQVERLISLGI